MYPFKTSIKSSFRSLCTISNEFIVFLVIFFVFNFYVWCTLSYYDEIFGPLHADAMEEISESSFEETISRISPHFAKFESNCRNNYNNYTLTPYAYITSVLTADWTYRLLFLYIVYNIVKYLENHYIVNRLTRIMLTYFVQKTYQQTKLFKFCKRFGIFLINVFILFLFYCVDVIYSRYRFGGDSINDNGLIDYSDVSIKNRILDFIYIYIRVHPTDAWIVRMSHAFSYPFTLYALSRPKISAFICVHALTIMCLVFHVGGLGHVLDSSDMQLRCVRRSFIWSTRGSSIHGEALRYIVGPYLNIMCLTINCAKYVF